MNKPEVNLSENVSERKCKSKGSRAPHADGSVEAQDKPPRKGRAVVRFLLRSAATAALLALVFLPKFLPYNGSEKVTDTVKTIIMTDITYSEKVGSGSLVDLIRKLFGFDAEK